MIYEKMHHILPLRRRKLLSPRSSIHLHHGATEEKVLLWPLLFLSLIFLTSKPSKMNKELSGLHTINYGWVVAMSLSKLWEAVKARKPAVRQFMGLQRFHDLATEEQHVEKRNISVLQ